MGTDSVAGTERRQLVLDSGRHLGIHGPLHQSVALEVAQRQGEHPLADRRAELLADAYRTAMT